MEWTTQSDEAPPAAEYGNGDDTRPLPTQLPTPPAPPQPPVPPAEHPHLREESLTPPVASLPLPVSTHAMPAPSATPQANPGYEQCPSCGAMVAVDQRYCLECGHRRGEPRLPFMDAVVFMDAMNKPPESAATATKSKKRGISPNTALIAGVGTLLLALGIGVLIGRSGHGSAPAAAAPQVVTVSGGGEEATASSSGDETLGASGGNGKKPPKKKLAKDKQQAAESGAGAEEVLHTAPGVTLPPATQPIGGKCNAKVAGCSKNGKFEGTFFGEE